MITVDNEQDRIIEELRNLIKAGKRFAFSKLGNEDDADDAVSSALPKTIRTFDPNRGTLIAFFFQKISTECHMIWRKNKGGVVTELSEDIADTVQNPDALTDFELLQVANETERLDDFGMTPRDKMLWAIKQVLSDPNLGPPLKLKYEEKLTYEEIAQSLNISVQAVKGRLSMARTRIRNLCGFVTDCNSGTEISHEANQSALGAEEADSTECDTQNEDQS